MSLTAAPTTPPAAPAMAPLSDPGPRVDGVERIAVLRSNGIGDFVVAVPALEALRAAYPDARITYLGTHWHPELLEGRPGPWDDVVVVPPYPGVRGAEGGDVDREEVERFFEARRRERYDLAVQLHGGGGNSNPFLSALGARVTAGARDVGAPALDRWVPYFYWQHEVLRFLEVVGLVGAAPVGVEPCLALTERDRSEGAQALAGLVRTSTVDGGQGSPGADLAGRVVTIHPGATDPRRRWPAASFAAVARDLLARGAGVVVVGHGADDVAASAEIVGALASAPGGADGRVLDLVGRVSVRGMCGVLAASDLVVGNDSGPRHLAAALGTATLGIYWSGNLINAGPLLRRHHRVAVSFRTTCPRCGRAQVGAIAERCDHDDSFVADVPVGEVLPQALDLLRGGLYG